MNRLLTKAFAFIISASVIFVSCFMLPGAKNKTEKLSFMQAQYTIPDSQFQIGAFSNGIFGQYDKLRDLGFNTWHFYTSLLRGWNYDTLDNAFAVPIQYEKFANNYFLMNSKNGLRTYFDRPIVEFIIAGQRVDYECEHVPNTSFYYFNRFDFIPSGKNNIREEYDKSSFGVNKDSTYAKVLHCIAEGMPAYIDSNLYANRNLSYNAAANPWCNAYAYDWYIMPRIRIEQSFALQSSNRETTVCVVYLYGWSGELVKEIPIKVINFINPHTGSYDGSYLETFFFPEGNNLQQVSKELIKKHFAPEPAYLAMNWDAPCYVDVKIKWSGMCDMWIDRVRFENEPAHLYMTLKEPSIIEKVNAEADRSMKNYKSLYPVPNYFYFEECTLNHFPSIKALNEQITERTNGRNGLIIWLNNYQINAQVPHFEKNLMDASKIFHLVNTQCGISEMVMGWYGLEGWSRQEHPERISLHPSTLYNGSFSPEKGVLSYPDIPWKYDGWLQNRFESDLSATFNLIGVYKIMDTLSRMGMRIISCPQAHSFFMPGGPLKEPTNEEIEVQTCLSIIYNAKGIMYYSYNSSGEFSTKGDWSRGLINNDGSSRSISVYGQDKFGGIKALNSRLQKWSKYIMSFDPLQTINCIVRNPDERSDFFNKSFIKDIVTFKWGSSGECFSDNPGIAPPEGLVYECRNERYVQAAVFAVSGSSYEKYFMILNRRCSPYMNDSNEDTRGGKRSISIKIDSGMPYFRSNPKWEVVDLETDAVLVTFDSEKSQFVSLGWFMPGQGKLYTIKPSTR